MRALQYLDWIHFVDPWPEVGRVAPEGDLQGLKKLVHPGQKRLWTGKNISTNKVQLNPYASINTKYKKKNKQVKKLWLHILKETVSISNNYSKTTPAVF